MFVFAACSSGGGGKTSTPAVPADTETVAATPSPAATATPDALAARDANAQHVLDDVRKLSVEIGPRVAGTPSEMQAATYLRDELAGYGYDVAIQDFAFDASSFRPSRVEVAGGDSIPAYAIRGSAEGQATGAVVNAGIGRPEEFPAGGVRGGIALMQRGTLTFTEKVQNAIAAGAAGVMVYNNVPGSLQGDMDTALIPAVGITSDAGQALITRMASGAVTATITVPAANATGHNVVAKPKGAGDCTTVTGGHYDSVPVTGGADDNASGAASVVEVARLAAANHLSGTNCFVLFSGEEFGLFGSKAFIRGLTADQLQKIRIMVNLDVVGISGAMGLIGDADTVESARLQAQKLGINATPSELPMGAGSDHLSFRDAGVPILMLSIEDSLIHTPKDAIDRIDMTSLDSAVRLAYGTLSALAPA